MTPEWVHPGLVLIAGAWLLPLLGRGPGSPTRTPARWGGRLRRVVMVLLPAVALLDCILMTPGTYGEVTFLGHELMFGRVDRLSLVFSYVFALFTVIGMVYALHVEDTTQHMAALTYAGAALGATFAGDFLSLFLFWELMAVCATLLVWLRREPRAIAAGFRYALVHVFGGVCLLGGIVLHWSEAGSLTFGDMTSLAGSPAFTLILIAFLVNAAVPPLGAWLPDAYPEATATGAVFLTAFTTKAAVYALIRGYAGTDILVWLGAVMSVYGVVYAVLENDARRLLAYHIVSQVGYMVCGVGIGTALALNGAAAHAFAHILYKALLFMGAGAVLHVTGLRTLRDMGGLYKTMPVTLALYMVGAFAISAVPLFSGFVSKAMVVSAAADAHAPAIFLLLTLASSGTFLHTGLKLPYYMFFGTDRRLRGHEPPSNMLVAMGLAAVACVLIGVAPALLYAHLPFAAEYAPYTARHVTATVGLLGFTALGFFLLLKHLDPEPIISLDTDWFSRKGGAALQTFAERGLTRVERVVAQISDTVMQWHALRAASRLSQLDVRVIDGAADAVGRLTQIVSRRLSMTVSGHAQYYALAMTAGALIAIAFAVFGP